MKFPFMRKKPVRYDVLDEASRVVSAASERRHELYYHYFTAAASTTDTIMPNVHWH